MPLTCTATSTGATLTVPPQDPSNPSTQPGAESASTGVRGTARVGPPPTSGPASQTAPTPLFQTGPSYPPTGAPATVFPPARVGPPGPPTSGPPSFGDPVYQPVPTSPPERGWLTVAVSTVALLVALIALVLSIYAVGVANRAKDTAVGGSAA